MGILVAGETVRRKAQVGPVEVLLPGSQCRSVPDVLRPVALAAVEGGVGALEEVAGLVVLEAAHPGITPPDQVELLAVMLDMAGAAVAVLGPRVQAAAGGDPIAQRLVTLQTALRCGAALPVVALQAVAIAVEMGMRSAELSGGDLRLGRRGEQDHGRSHEEPRDRPGAPTRAVHAPHRPGPHP